MKKVLIISILLIPLCSFSQVILKVGGGFGNRWNETLNSQTIGTGFRLLADKFVVKKISFGLCISHFAFAPTKLVNVRFSSAGLSGSYDFNNKKLQPYIGLLVGYTYYTSNTSIDLGNGITSSISRNKNYGMVSPFTGLKYSFYKKTGMFLQVNTDFVPVDKISPIGFWSATVGFCFQL